MSNVKYLGIDIGGAHFKLVGLDEKNSVCFAEYRKCYVWEGLQNLRKEIDYTNSLKLQKNSFCGITMTQNYVTILKVKNKELLKFSNYVRK